MTMPSVIGPKTLAKISISGSSYTGEVGLEAGFCFADKISILSCFGSLLYFTMPNKLFNKDCNIIWTDSVFIHLIISLVRRLFPEKSKKYHFRSI